MKLFRSIRFEKNYAKAPQEVRRAFDKQSSLLTKTSVTHRYELRSTTRAGTSGRLE